MENTLSIDLLAPRYECIADLPFNDRFEVGDVLEFFAAKDRDKKEYWYHHDQTHQNFQDVWFDTYPHLFRKLQWWEKRKVEEMPQYVRVYETSAILKVEKHFHIGDPDGLRRISVVDSKDYTVPYSILLPATEQEYTEYIKSKT